MKRTDCIYIVSVLILIITAGCENSGSSGLTERINILESRNSELKNQIKDTEAHNIQLKEQLKHLLGLGPGINLSEFYSIKKIKITRYTDFYDKDNDGSEEKLIVYIQPFDFPGDVVKATGEVSIELWNLNSRDNPLVRSWRISPEQLSKLWHSSLLRTNYRIELKRPEETKDLESELTLKVSFTDYLTGKDFTAQHIIHD